MDKPAHAVEERENKDPNRHKVPLMENVLKEMIQFGLIYPPFRFSTLESKMAMLILLEGNTQDHYSRKPHHIF